jgi:hypothetical protein
MMGGEYYTMRLSLRLEPGEYPEDAVAWNLVREKASSFLDYLRRHPGLAEYDLSLEFSHDGCGPEETRPSWLFRYAGGAGQVAEVGDLVEVEPTTIPFDRPKWTIRQRGHVQQIQRSRVAVLLEGTTEPVTFAARDLSLIQAANEE